MTRIWTRAAALLLSAALLLGLFALTPAQAKTTMSESGQNIFFYALDRSGKSVLLKVIPIEELQALSHGQLSQVTSGEDTGVNYYVSSTDNYPTTQYCEARGITLLELVDYVRGETTASGASSLSFSSGDTLRFMATDSYGNYSRSWTYDELYGEKRYYFPGLYDGQTGWNSGWEVAGEDGSKSGVTLEEYYASYQQSDPYYEDKRAVFATGVESTPILATVSLSGRTTSSALTASTELGISDYIAANGGQVTGCLADSLTGDYALRLCLPMTEADLMAAHRTAYDNFKWIYNIRLDTAGSTSLTSRGTVAAPTASATQSADGSTLTFTLSCATAGASIYYSFDGAPQTLYTGPVTLDVSDRELTSQPVTLYLTAVREGYDDAGILTVQYPGMSPALQTVYSGMMGSDLVLTAADEVTGAEWSDWADAITSVTIKTPSAGGYVRVEEDAYAFDRQARSVTFRQSLFAESGAYTLIFHAAGYADKSVSLTMKSPLPQVTVPTQSFLGEDLVLTFDDDSYQQGLSLYIAPQGGSSVLISPSYLDRTVPGQVTIRAAYFSLDSCPVDRPGVYTLSLVNSGYDPGSQEVTLTLSRRFADVPSDAWYAGAVDYAVVNGLFGGTSETTFEPEDIMTRAMFVTVMSNAMGADVSGYAPGEFSDVTEGDWFARYVSWAAQTGLVAGTGGGQFSPDEPITLEQMAAILYQDAGAPAVSGGLPEEVGTVSGWAESAMRWAGEAGLLDGVGGALSAQGGATRAQVAQMMQNYCERTEETA